MPGQFAPRRTVLKGAALAGAAGLGAAACSTESKLGRAKPLPSTPVPLGAADEVPVGGAKLYREQRIVVSCPAEGEFKAFSAQCTHAGCVLDKVEKGEGNCPCHGSRFDLTTGEVLRGPATVPLPAIPVEAKAGRLVAVPGPSPEA
ncbi:Rieske (2Fe-2S) protein [Streptomyces hypolithicus]